MKKILILTTSLLFLVGCTENNSMNSRDGINLDAVLNIFIKNADGDNLVWTHGYTTFSVYYMRNGVKTLEAPSFPQWISYYVVYIDSVNQNNSLVSVSLDNLTDKTEIECTYNTDTWFDYHGKETKFTAELSRGYGYCIVTKLWQDGVKVWDRSSEKSRVVTIIDQ